MEQFSYDERELDKQQLQLNWKRAKTFAHYFGKPNPKRVDLVMTKWVPPLDPTGRPVPSWLTFEPTAMNSEQIASAAETADLSQLQGSTDSVWTPKHSLAAITQSLAESSAPANPAAPKAGATSPKADATASQADAAVKKPENCILQTSCHGCTGNGCHWCGGGSICAVSCPAALGAQTYTKLEQCDAETSTLSSQPAGSDVKTQGSSEDNSAPMKRVASAQERQRRNREELKDLVHLSSITAGNVLVDTDLAVEFKLRAQDVHSKDDPSGPSLAQALAPLDDEQTALNHRREMLYFRMETNIHPGERHSSGLPPGEGVGRMDNFVKPTTTWSLIGRPMTGWLHWGNENDGGFLNPAGGTQWNPAVVNPAENKKSWGRATSQYAAQHPASMAGGALFGT